ncbi:DUF4097 family beta strand repeat-containing protein [Paenibacillus wynnii]|uniref:DUF4097 family beta strand repeat-containing protein n=1 Tax=Paenibacillus wynnii TaxID=268407 RepID=UPI00279183E4|nr:DUF4097 family beta strand repeat-containing protein [Paenibacillus wynnii]MDQ0195118.1 DUF4097 and DUF4098 domain-containing protein YvlB [Paenibacillus wynnii]
MGRWKIGSLTAAIGCIALGVIIGLVQYGELTYAALGYLWPVLLIALGLEMLGRLMIRSEVKSRVSGWAILLIILLIGASAGQSALSGGSFNTLFGNMKLTPLNGAIEVKSEIKAVKISIPNGKVKINGVTGSLLDYEGSLLVPGDSESEALSALEKKWLVTTEGDTLVLKLDEKTEWFNLIQFGFNSKNPYLNVNIPQNLAVEIDTSDGSIEAMELESGLIAETSNGTMDLHDIVGDVQAHSSNGSLTAKNIQGKVELVSSNGAISLDHIEGSLTAKSSNGKIMINSDITGDWKCTSSNGKIQLDLPSGVNATITGDTSNGSLKGNVPWDRDGDNHGTAALGDGSHKVDLSTSNGSVTVDVME